MRGDLSRQRTESQRYRPAVESRPKHGEPRPVRVSAFKGLVLSRWFLQVARHYPTVRSAWRLIWVFRILRQGFCFFLSLTEGEWMDELMKGCQRIGRNLNDTRGLLHSFRDCREQINKYFRYNTKRRSWSSKQQQITLISLVWKSCLWSNHFVSDTSIFWLKTESDKIENTICHGIACSSWFSAWGGLRSWGQGYSCSLCAVLNWHLFSRHYTMSK